MIAKSRALDKIYKRRDRYEIPEWQREEVWNTKQKQKLIDSILRGWRLPKLYFHKTSDTPEEFEVLDGQQRLIAIWEFFDGDLELSKESQKVFGGKTHKDLSDDIMDAFDDYELEYDEITEASEEDQKEFFLRLQEGLRLNTSEKLNAVHSKLRDYCVRVAKHDFFSEVTPISNKRYAYFDILAKVVTLEIEGLDAGLRLDDVKKVFEDNKAFSGNSAVAKRVKGALDILNRNLAHPEKLLRNRTLVQSVVTLTCHLMRSGLEKEQHKHLASFIKTFLSGLAEQVEKGQEATDNDYLRFQKTVNANVRTGPRTRNDILLKKLFQYHPDFYSAFQSSASISGGLAQSIKESSDAIKLLVSQINEVHAAKHGKDLFKPTNKTLSVLASGLDSHTDDIDSYKSFIEGLYFLFKEGVGTRLDTMQPIGSFQDVNALRTLNEHDVDHGKAGKVAKKRTDLAEVFRKYSGAHTPESVDPHTFTLVQANLLGALEADLARLLNTLSKD